MADVHHMVTQYYNVVEEYDQNKSYGIKIRNQYVKCLALLKKGDKVNPYQFTEAHLNEFTKKPRYL